MKYIDLFILCPKILYIFSKLKIYDIPTMTSGCKVARRAFNELTDIQVPLFNQICFHYVISLLSSMEERPMIHGLY